MQVATLHRVNTTMVPESETRVSLPFFLIPKMEGALVPFVDDGDDGDTTGYQADRDRGTNAAVNRMGTFPTCTLRWWNEEYRQLLPTYLEEKKQETKSAYRLAEARGGKPVARL